MLYITSDVSVKMANIYMDLRDANAGIEMKWNSRHPYFSYIPHIS